jgi:hypothetical protein
LDQKLILVNLLIKLGVAAAVSSTLVRSREFKKDLPDTLVQRTDCAGGLDSFHPEKFPRR